MLSNGSKVRLLSINTPEIESPHRSGEPGGEEVRLWLKEAVEGKKVYLEKNVEKVDRYKRLLSHLFTEQGVHLNRVLVSLGLVSVALHPPNLKYSQRRIRSTGGS
jgi:micrococcal nuclease